VYAGFWWGNLRERDHLEDPCLDGRIRLRWIFRILDEGHGLDLSGLEWGGATGCCEYGNEPSGFVKYVEFLTS
jgi:hypothetical protein